MNTSKDVSHIAKFDGQNYSLWKLGLWVLLEQHNLIDIVTGDYPIPQMKEDAESDAQLAIIAEIQDWKERDVRARGYILSTTEVSTYRLTPNIYNPVDNFPTLYIFIVVTTTTPH